MTRDKLAAMSNVQVRTVQRLEAGRAVSVETLADVSAALKLTPAAIRVRSDDKAITGREVSRWTASLRRGHSAKTVLDVLNAAALADDTWRDQMKATGVAKTQVFSQRLMAQDYHGLMVRSFAPGAGVDDLNLVLWRWGAAAPSSQIATSNHRAS